MAHSILEAIKMGIWDFEPDAQDSSRYQSTKALPGTQEKLNVLARRVQQGVPLWHPQDRRCYEEAEPG